MSDNILTDWRWWVGAVVGGLMVGLFDDLHWPAGAAVGLMFTVGYILGQTR